MHGYVVTAKHHVDLGFARNSWDRGARRQLALAIRVTGVCECTEHGLALWQARALSAAGLNMSCPASVQRTRSGCRLRSAVPERVTRGSYSMSTVVFS